MNMEEVRRHASNPLWDSEPSKLTYTYPVPLESAETGSALLEGIPEDQIRQVGPFFTAASPESHIGPFKNAIDFLVADGTPVLAAADGRIIEVQESSSRWGDGEEFRDLLNYMTIDHGNGEFTQYCHLGLHSVSESEVWVGSNVKAGQQIAIVGKTGWTDRDHLHFIVFRGDRNTFGFKSLVPKFK